ncbi:MAG TPA: hypothetical protein VJ842_04435 [Pyrinomonadaceae bacterium]|nr:hypothetical protein [Pyrinomonadaceae bacterium]
MDIEQIVNQYRENFSRYERFTSKFLNLLEELLSTHNISYTAERRTKDVEQFREKITRPNKNYTNPLSEVTDLCGIRIIVRQLADVAKVIEIIKSEFSVNDKNSVYKSEELNVDQFGYTSVHLVVKLHSGRTALTEWRSFEDINIEIQIRTILQHAWAVISHPFDYKVGADIPREFRRRLFRLSALFELADEELDQLVEEIQDKIKEYRRDLDQGKTKIELNVDSLRAYIETETEIEYWADIIEKGLGKRPVSFGDISRAVRLAEFCGLKTIEDIQNLLINARGWGEKFISDYYREAIERYSSKMEKSIPTLDGIVSTFLIVANIEKFTPEILLKDFGYSESPIFDVAPKFKNAKQTRHKH